MLYEVITREVIEQLVRKLKDTISRRYARWNRGVLDIKKTLRRAAGYQGLPMELFYRNHPLRKTKIVTLCDVSGSVWSAARFMLNIRITSYNVCYTKLLRFWGHFWVKDFAGLPWQKSKTAASARAL